MILGELCTRRCSFCSVPQGLPKGEVDFSEPQRVSRAAAELGLRHVVVTSSTRDDLSDGGAEMFYETILALKTEIPGVAVEVLTPDFKGKEKPILRVADAKPSIYNHNLETVPRLYREVRPGSLYDRSLDFIETVKTKRPDIVTKSGIMVGLGETPDEVLSVLRDLHAHGCDIATIGQYLKPEEDKHEVVEFVPPERFALYAREGRKMGFKAVFSGPFVRSSYHAAETFLNAQAS